MSAHLSALLCARYPALYGEAFYFECLDGWAGILDALSETLVWHAEIERRSVPEASQVKEKYGSLRWYHGESDQDDGAIAIADEMSTRICEKTGRPGRLGVRSGWWATRAPGVETGLDYRRWADLPVLGVTPDDLRNGRADVFVGELEIPEGWLDLVDGMLRQLARAPSLMRPEPAGTFTVVIGRPAPAHALSVRVSKIWRGVSGDLRAEFVGGGAYAQGIIACATALARRTDAQTGIVAIGM